jgi:hypothetical protein
MNVNLIVMKKLLFLSITLLIGSSTAMAADVEAELASCPDNSTLINGVCECQMGLDFDEDDEVCVDSTLWCQKNYGANIIYDLNNDTCACEGGYSWMEDKNECVTLDEVCKTNYGVGYSYVDGECVGTGGGGDTDGLFTDVDENHANYAAIKFLHDMGVLEGYDDGSFQPKKTVNRAELLKILIEGQGVTPSVQVHKDCFIDVAQDWFAPYVCYAKDLNWVEGYGDGSYRPGQDVTNTEAIKMLLLSQGVEIPDSVEITPFADVPVDEWFAPYLFVAQELEILEETGANFYPGSDRTRAEISENLYRLLTE